MKKSTRPAAAKKSKVTPKKAGTIKPDDRLGPDEPLDEANARPGKTSDADLEEAPLASEHRVRKIEPDDEHNAENLTEEGMQGNIGSSLVKPRSASKK